MKVALCTTTINVPKVLELYRKLDQNVEFFIAGDLKSPHEDIQTLCAQLGNAHYIHPSQQEPWKCSKLIAWNCIQRRVIAYLEALKAGADVIYSWDDDNLGMDIDHFGAIRRLFAQPFNGLQALSDSNPNAWFDPGQLLLPPAKHRGIPFDNNPVYTVSHITNAKIGVAAGMCLGDPDVDAVTRMERSPVVHGVSELLNAGIVVDARCRTVFNSQNTAFIRELAPAMFLWPGVGRSDDLLASLVCQRAMRETGHVVHFGKPFVWQQRNQHNLLTDLKHEIFGMENIQALADHLEEVDFPQHALASVLAQMRWYCDSVYGPIPLESLKACKAWLDDCESVL